MSKDNISFEISDHLKDTAQKIIDLYSQFGVKIGPLINASKGARVTSYEFELLPNSKVSKITRLRDDISLLLSVPKVRIICPIPEKLSFAVEVYNKCDDFVNFDDIFNSDSFKASKDKLCVVLGKNLSNQSVCLELSKAPHLLIGGQEFSGKTTLLKSMALSLVRNNKSSEIKLLIITPKKDEYVAFENSSHLMLPIISDKLQGIEALKNLCQECERRLKLFLENSVKCLDAYNSLSNEIIPKIVVLVDETEFLSKDNPSDYEFLVYNLAQKGRAAGIHIVLATGDLSFKSITGIIKANIPTRIAFKVQNPMESRTIMDASDAECLLSKGDMLLCPMFGKPQRIQAAHITDEQIEQFIKN